MLERIDLNSGWKYAWTEFQGDTEKIPGIHWVREATVPGDAHLDLMREGAISDPFVGMNADHARWMETKDWWYRREFETPAGLGSRRAILVFHGLDTFATVWVNDQVIGRAANMFIRHEFDVTAFLKPSGANLLKVRLAAPAYSVQMDPAHQGISVWSPERLFCRKAQMSFGWDIAPRLVTVGIWRPVELLLVDTARIRDFRIVLDGIEGRDAVVRVEAGVDWLEKSGGPGRMTGAVAGVEWEVQAGFHPGENLVAQRIVLRNAPLWQPIGCGRPNLCEATVNLESGGRQLDGGRVRTGLRRIEMIQEPQPSGATSFRFRCNGRDAFITGFNWTPLDAVFARVTAERISSTLEMLAGIGCNMVRVWGGGIYESSHFYNECDRLGIMVWQDFMMACGRYPQTDAFAASIETEARQVVRDLRHHPCLALWAGDNECDMATEWMRKSGLAGGNRLTREVLPRICRELNPEVPYVPSSPWSPSGAHWSSQTEGDFHCYTHGQDYRQSDLWTARCRFMSEFGRLS